MRNKTVVLFLGIIFVCGVSLMFRRSSPLIGSSQIFSSSIRSQFVTYGYSESATVVFDDLDDLIESGMSLYEIGVKRMLQMGISRGTIDCKPRDVIEAIALSRVASIVISVYEESMIDGERDLVPIPIPGLMSVSGEYSEDMDLEEIRINPYTSLPTPFDENGELILSNGQEMIFHEKYQEVNLINRVANDRAGTLWVGTTLFSTPRAGTRYCTGYHLVAEFTWTRLPDSKRSDFFGLTLCANSAISARFGRQVAGNSLRFDIITQHFTVNWDFTRTITQQLSTPVVKNNVDFQGNPSLGLAIRVDWPTEIRTPIWSRLPGQPGTLTYVANVSGSVWYSGFVRNASQFQGNQLDVRHWTTYTHQLNSYWWPPNPFFIVNLPIGAPMSISPNSNHTDSLVHMRADSWKWNNNDWDFMGHDSGQWERTSPG